MNARAGCVCLVVLASLAIASPLPLQAFPRQDGYVNDFAEILDEPSESYLEDFLGTLERDTFAEVVIATVTSLAGMTVEEYANRLFADWTIGRAEPDNGVLLVVAPRERAVRIEVGYGLEPMLPDGRVGDIIRNEVLPEFRSGNLPRGIGRGINRISQILRGSASSGSVYVPAPGARGGRHPGQPDTADAPPLVFVIPFLGAFVALGAFSTGLGIRTRTIGPLIFGVLFEGAPLVMIAAVRSMPALAILLPVGLVAMAIGYRKGGSPYWISTLRSSAHDSARGDTSTWIMGSTADSSGSSSSDVSSSSDSGGSSGGGGASGHW
jgi:uncharacterized protein